MARNSGVSARQPWWTGQNSGKSPENRGKWHETREFLPDNRGGCGGWTEWMMDFEGRRLATLRLTAPHDKGYIIECNK